MNLIKFDISHFDAMEIEESDHLRREYRPMYEAYALRGPAYTMLDENGRPLTCGGIFIIRPGIGEIWMTPGRDLPEHPVSAYRVGKVVMDEAFNKLHLHRVQATVMMSDVRGQNYIKAFGFCFEGLLRKYGENKEDYLLFARTE